MSDPIDEKPMKHISWWIPVVLTAMAGGMGWGIRGQYGHETGAMIPGLLVSSTLVFLLIPHAGSLPVARAIAWGTVAMGIGGTMTYGQTVGLTHDTPLVGNWDALRWGMLGLAIKGGIWIGFAGLFLGMGLSGVRYRAMEVLLLLAAMLVAAYIGILVLNSPFDPENRVLPWIYFSDDWYWEPEGGFTPRRETWGGLLFALAVGIAYAGWVKKDRLARNLGLWGILAGAMGFPGGQSVQASHVWNREMFKDGFLRFITTGMNPWNMMETAFGTIMGAILGLGAWLNRGKIRPVENPVGNDGKGRFPAALEWVLLAIHIPLLVAVDFGSSDWVDYLYDFGPVMAAIPLFAITAGRRWPYLQIFTVTLIPIAGKTLRNLAYQTESIGRPAGWIVYVIVPIVLATAFSFWVASRGGERQGGLTFARRALLFSTWLYFLLNYALFHYPWPWLQHHHSGLMFTVCVIGLTLGAVLLRRGRRLARPQVTGD